MGPQLDPAAARDVTSDELARFNHAEYPQILLRTQNYLFVGHEEAGENIAGLFSIVAS